MSQNYNSTSYLAPVSGHMHSSLTSHSGLFFTALANTQQINAAVHKL